MVKYKELIQKLGEICERLQKIQKIWWVKKLQ